MKKIYFLICLCLSFLSAVANNETVNTYLEPNFIGEVYVINEGETLLLEKQKSLIHAKATAVKYLLGIGDVKVRVQIANELSSTRIKKGEDLKFLVRVENNRKDPLAGVTLFKFEQKKGKRTAIIKLEGPLISNSATKLNQHEFVAERYGEFSYLLSVKNLEEGEYGILVDGTIGPDGMIVISTFGVGDN